MKVFVAVMKKQALEAADVLRGEAQRMSDDPEERAIIGIEVSDTVPTTITCRKALTKLHASLKDGRYTSVSVRLE